MTRTLLLPSCLLAIGVAGCTADLGQSQDALGIEGRWFAPAHILADGDTQYVSYTGAGPWLGEAESCEGSFTTGGQLLSDYLAKFFPQTYSIGGYACRPIVGNDAQTSVHATGRALDIMIPLTAEGGADNDLGDPIAHWLIQNAESIGIQFIIWDRSTWGADRPEGDKQREYTGEHPHDDHLHVELSVAGGAAETPWFAGPQEPPSIDSCPPMPAEGGILDDTDPCTQLMGPSQYWRIEEGIGYGDRLAWTDAQGGAEPGNWGRWQIALSEAGLYEVEIYLDSEFAVHSDARYALDHAEQSSEAHVDQSERGGWTSLGEFDFAAGNGQALALFDNSEGEIAEDQHIAMDAMRLTRLDGEGEGEDTLDVFGSCSAGGGQGGGGALLVLLALAWRQRRSERNAVTPR